MSVRESGNTPPFIRGPFRRPVWLLWLGGMIIYIGTIAFSRALGAHGGASLPSLLVALCGFGLVGSCAWVANDQRGGQTMLYGAVIATLSLSVWLAADDFNRRHERRATELRLVSDLNVLCSRAGGRSLFDPVCADYLRLLDNYRYPRGIPAFALELRRQALSDGDNPRE